MANTQPKIRYHIPFLDGIRGISALYVVLHHTYYKFTLKTNNLPTEFPELPLGNFFRYGQFAVTIFIVLSGFVLMLPLIQKDRLTFDEIKNYFVRRVRRIFPPYYVALILSILLIYLRSIAFKTERDSDISFWPITSHLLMFHNINPAWRTTINAPMWSVATEWQIYFILPFFFFPILKKFGSISMLFSAGILAFIPLYLPVFQESALSIRTHMIFAFALGSSAAVFFTKLASSLSQNLLATNKSIHFLSFALISVTILISLYMPNWSDKWDWRGETFVAISTALSIYSLSTLNLTPTKNKTIELILHFLESRFSKFLGKISYSLYLIHSPIQAALFTIILRLNLATNCTDDFEFPVFLSGRKQAILSLS